MPVSRFCAVCCGNPGPLISTCGTTLV
jgi:hypothetical protein